MDNKKPGAAGERNGASRMIGVFANPIPPSLALAVGILLVGLQPEGPGSWVIALSSLAWLNASLVLRRSRRTVLGTPSPEEYGDAKAWAVSTVVGVILIASMSIGMMTWALAVAALGLPASAVGALAATFAVALLHAAARRRVIGADRTKLPAPSALAFVAALGVVAGSVCLWLLLGGA